MKRQANRLLLVLGLLTATVGGLTTGSATAAPGPQQLIVNEQTNGSLMPYKYGDNPNDGRHIYTMRTDRARGGDRWEFESLGGGDNLIRNTKTGKCLKPGGAYSHRTGVVQWTCNHTPEFRWRLESTGYQSYKIRSVASRQVLAPHRGRSHYERVVLERDTNASVQRWSVNPLY